MAKRRRTQQHSNYEINAIEPIHILMEKAEINNIEERVDETSDLPYRLNAPSSAH